MSKIWDVLWWMTKKRLRLRARITNSEGREGTNTQNPVSFWYQNVMDYLS